MDPDLSRNNKYFIALLITLQLIILVFYRFFYQVTRYDETGVALTSQHNVQFYPMYQDVNVMMLVGFGFLMTFVKHGSLSALCYTFFINAVVVQFYLLWSSFWGKVMHGFGASTVFIRQQNFTSASYSVASILIAFGAVLGRVGPYQLLCMAMIQLIVYTLNQVICYELIQIYDVGGSTVIHTLGAYFGLGVSLALGWKKKPGPGIKAEANKMSSTFAMLGTLFLWVYWPSFNAGYFPANGQQKSIIIVNTILSLTGSCLGGFIMTSFLRQKFDMEDILNATLAGGVVIGAASGLFTQPAASLTAGLIGGIISAVGYRFLTKYLQQKIGLLDTCGVHNLHGIPGILGGILSSIAIAAYQSSSMDSRLAPNLLFFSKTHLNRSLSTQAWFQILGTINSLGIGLIAGIITGYLISFDYGFKNQHFYKDVAIFQVEQQQWKQGEGSVTKDSKLKQNKNKNYNYALQSSKPLNTHSALMQI